MSAATQSFELALISPSMSKTLEISWVHIQGTTGSFLVGPGHRPLIAILKPKGELRYRTPNGDEHTLNIIGGLVRVSSEQAMVILDK